MKKLVLVVAAALAMSSVAATAADLPRRGPPVAKAPAYVAPPLYNWSGFYAGVHIGGAWSDSDYSAFLVPSLATDPGGFLGGGQIGYNWQFDRWVLGLEADISGIAASSSSTTVPPFTATTDLGWAATFTGRAGYTWDNWMVYGRFGLALLDADYGLATAVAGTTVSDVRVGWLIGIGVEYGFWNAWSAKLEYNYMDFGSENYTFLTGAGFVPTSIDTQVHAIKVGVNYRFGGIPLISRY